MLLETMRRTHMFSGIAVDRLEAIVGGCRLVAYPKGTYLFHEGEVPEGFFIVQSGAVNVHRVTADGREQVIRVFYPGECFGEVILAQPGGYPASAVATENSQVILVPKVFFREQILRDPDLALCILASMSQHLKFLVETVEDLKLKQAECRIAQWLLRQTKAEGVKVTDSGALVITLQSTKRLLASQLGITSETFSRVLARFKEENLVLVDGKEITLLSPEGLGQFAVSLE